MDYCTDLTMETTNKLITNKQPRPSAAHKHTPSNNQEQHDAGHNSDNKNVIERVGRSKVISLVLEILCSPNNFVQG